MPQGTFNFQRLTRELGLKNIIEMPPTRSIQPVIPLESMIGQVPYHAAPMALFGGFQGAVAAEFGALEVASLDPGGCLILWNQIGLAGPVTYTISVTGTPVTWGAAGPVNAPAQNFGVDPIESTAAFGTVAAAAAVGTPTLTSPMPSSRPALHLPKGQRLLMQSATANSGVSMVVAIMGIAATQSEE